VAFRDFFEQRVEAIVDRIFSRLLAKYIGWAFPDGRIASVSADGKRADIYLNNADVIAGTDAKTLGVPIAPHVTGLTAGNEVIVLRRGMRDMMIIAVKTL
jgi:hypothetical protein